MNRHELIVDDQCRKKSGSVDLDFRVGGIRDVNSIALRELIDSELESGREFFSFSPLYLTVLPSSAN
jgi:hypothetical protein